MSRVLAMWSGVPEPFMADGSLSRGALLEHPVVVVMWSEATGGARLYHLWRDERGAPTGETFDGTGQCTHCEVDRLVETVASAVAAHD